MAIDNSQSWTQTIDTLYTSTWSDRKGPATEQAFKNTPFIFWLNQAGRIKPIDGGTRLEIHLEYGSNETVKWIQKGSTVPITDQELLTMAYEDWKYVSVSVVRWFADEQKNRGRNQIINILSTKLGTAERAMNEELERVMFADGTGPLEPNGLQNIISNTPTTGTLHGLSRADLTWWRNLQKTATGAAAIYLLSDMRTLMNNLAVYTKVNMKDLAIVTDQTSFELFEDVHMDMKVLNDVKLADAGFMSFSWKGRPIMWCPSAPSLKMYFANTSYIKLAKDNNYWMEMTEWKTIPNQPFDRVAQIVSALQMCTSRPVASGVLTVSP